MNVVEFGSDDDELDDGDMGLPDLMVPSMPVQVASADVLAEAAAVAGVAAHGKRAGADGQADSTTAPRPHSEPAADLEDGELEEGELEEEPGAVPVAAPIPSALAASSLKRSFGDASTPGAVHSPHSHMSGSARKRNKKQRQQQQQQQQQQGHLPDISSHRQSPPGLDHRQHQTQTGQTGNATMPARKQASKKQPANDRSKQRQPARPPQAESKAEPKARPPCAFWAKFQCTAGSSCLFSHDGPGGDPRSKQVCRYFKSGSCLSGSQCPFSHNLKDSPCVFHHFKKEKGGCRHGDACPYSHDPITEEQQRFLDREQETWESQQRVRQPLAGASGASVGAAPPAFGGRSAELFAAAAGQVSSGALPPPFLPDPRHPSAPLHSQSYSQSYPQSYSQLRQQPDSGASSAAFILPAYADPRSDPSADPRSHSYAASLERLPNPWTLYGGQSVE